MTWWRGVRNFVLVVDALFSLPRLAAVYDPLDPDRPDLEVYAAIAAEFRARSVLDTGAGPGRFCLPARVPGFRRCGSRSRVASLDIARGKPFADRFRWVRGFADLLPPLSVDLATMTGNVAQVYVSDEEWAAVLAAASGGAAARRPRLRDP